MNKLPLISFIAAMMLLVVNSYASINVTSVNATIVLNATPTAHVIEILSLQISNASVATYQQDRVALNLTINDWQKVLGSGYPSEYILNPKSSISGLTLLPGPLIQQGPNGGGIALLTMDYYAMNVTTSSNVGPRKFEYVFNDSALNFEHSASGEALPTNVRFNIIIPQGSSLLSIYPIPDAPSGLVNNYQNVTAFSWYGGEPLQKFTFSYIVTESLQQEVINYFTKVYYAYGVMIALVLVIIVVVGVVYLYTRSR